MGYDGKGIDRLGTKEDGLKFRWNWGIFKKYRPSQVCHTYWKIFKLESISWNDNFEATVSLRLGYAQDHAFVSKGEFKTRLDAQFGAETLLLGFLRDCYEYKKLLEVK